VLVKGYCRFNVNDAGAIKLSPRMPGLGQGFAMGLDLYLTARPAGSSDFIGLINLTFNTGASSPILYQSYQYRFRHITSSLIKYGDKYSHDDL
jgi:hypothetical protein